MSTKYNYGKNLFRTTLREKDHSKSLIDFN